MSDIRPPEPNVNSDSVWTYRGYKLRSGEFTTAMVHFFRAEVTRTNVWRQRLDTTTNWAVVTTGAAVSIAFTNLETFADVILLNMLLITMFLWIEARRYRYYELWSERVRLLETDFFAAMLVPPFAPSADWAESLAESLLQPDFPISMLEALGRRVRRNYWWLFIAVLLSWVGKLYLHPQPAMSFAELVSRAAIGQVSGTAIFIGTLLYVSTFLMVGLLTMGLHEASGEVLPRFIGEQLAETKGQAKGFRAWFRHANRRKQFLAMIITGQAEAISQQIFEKLKRGATRLQGMGMYTGEARDVLLCALTVTEINHLKALVNAQDPTAFVIISPAQEILGRGFMPLEVKK
jgi:uncharacterized membrane protein